MPSTRPVKGGKIMANRSMSALPSVSSEGGLSRYLQEIRQFPMLQPDEEFMLAKQWKEHGDREAAHKLVTSHLRLVAKIAMGYRGYGLPISEVVSEGNVGLMQAVKRFEPDKGFRLATYAMWWIKASIQEFILRSWSLVKMGTTASQKKLFFNLRKVKGQIQALEEGDLRPDQVKEIARRLGVPEEDVLVESEEKRMRLELLTEAMDKLTDRERRVFEARRMQEDPATLEDLSQEFGVSRERIRQIEVRAFEKVQKAVKNAAQKALAPKSALAAEARV